MNISKKLMFRSNNPEKKILKHGVLRQTTLFKCKACLCEFETKYYSVRNVESNCIEVTSTCPECECTVPVKLYVEESNHD